MNRNMRMFLLALLVGALIVAVIVTFVSLGAMHPVPWVLTVLAVAIPVVVNLRERSQFVRWKDSYSVGIKVIDEDHKKLFILIDQLQTAVRYNTGDAFEKQALDALIDYTRYHFRREEDLMEQNGYPDLEAHKAEHCEMIAKVEGFVADYEKRGHPVLEEVAGYLKSWLVNHINGTDQKYAPFLREKGVA